MPHYLEHEKKLKKIAALLADLQKDLAKRSDRGSDEYIKCWEDLSWIRQKLDEYTRYGFVLYCGNLPEVRTSA